MQRNTANIIAELPDLVYERDPVEEGDGGELGYITHLFANGGASCDTSARTAGDAQSGEQTHAATVD